MSIYIYGPAITTFVDNEQRITRGGDGSIDHGGGNTHCSATWSIDELVWVREEREENEGVMLG